jgi:hypothetical protein
MGTTLQEDLAHFDKIEGQYGTKRPSAATGRLVFAGSYWPPRQKNALMYNDVEHAIREARGMAVKGYLTATAAVAGDARAASIMEQWFGPRPVKPMNRDEQDWWEGARSIIGAIETFIVKDVNVYYRGDASLIGKPTDYPGERGRLTAGDVGGYAESAAGAVDSIIGLCQLFFRKQTGTGQSKMNLRGLDSVGGTLVHELSHNLCETEDHEAPNGKSCYGSANCLALAAQMSSRAWYNADNIEYFCETAYYGSAAAGAAAIATGAAQGVANLRAKFEPKNP